MARVTEADVRDIMDTNVDTDALSFWIEWATDLVDASVAEVAADYDITTSQLEQIERLVAAHGVAAQDPTEQSASVGDQSVTYETADPSEGLKETRYGRRALAMDPSGRLQAHTLDTPQFTTYPVEKD